MKQTCVLTVILLMAMCRASEADSPGVAGRGRTDATEGAALYEHICQGCHMRGGTGASGAGAYPKLAGDAALASWQYVAITLLNGRSNMPAFGVPSGTSIAPRTALLSDSQIAAVVNYVRNNFGNRYGCCVTAAQVEQLPHPTATAHP